jgi:predicted transcriptional regulator
MPDTTPHVPSDKTRAEVAALTSFGNTQEEIASYLGICVDTLAKHYRYELDTAVTKANAAVANKLYRKAVEQDDLSAQIFWLKTRARWRTQDHKDDAAKKSHSEQLFEQQFIE